MTKGDLTTARSENRKKAKAVAVEKEDRDGRFFVAIPFDVILSAGYRRASHTARSLLIDICSQDARYRNGKLVVTGKALRSLQWKSEGTMRRALAELIDCGLLVQTRAGSLNSAAWYAVTWRGLDQTEGLDIDPGAWKVAHRGSYRSPSKPASASKSDRAARLTRAAKPRFSAPSQGAQVALTAPSQGAGDSPVAPSQGAVMAENGASPAPSQGDLSRAMPSMGAGIDPAKTRMGRLLAVRSAGWPIDKPDGYAAARARLLAAKGLPH